MILLHNCSSSREYLKARLKEMPGNGYGQSNKLAKHLKVHTSLVSQILKGPKCLTMEQASLTAEFLGLTDHEADYFLLLVQWERAGNSSLKRNLQRQLMQQKKKNLELANVLKSETKLREAERAVFYSDWIYSAIRQLTAIPEFDTAEKIASYLNISRSRVRNSLVFLIKNGLCVEKNETLTIGPKSTHLESSSPWVRVHHINWRQKAIENINEDKENKLHYSCPMTLAAEDAVKIREILVKSLENIDKVIEPSPSEKLYCLNMDWFQI